MELDLLGEGFKYFGMLVAAGGGGAAIVFGVFQSWGKGWLDAHFDKRLEQFKHEQAKEIERLKLEISTSFDRAQRFHEYEFNSLPSIWSTINDVYYQLLGAVAPIRLGNGIHHLDETTLIDILKKNDFEQSDIDFVINGSKFRNKELLADRQSRFNYLSDHQRLVKVEKSYQKAQSYFSDNKIFLSEKICRLADSLLEEIYGVLHEAKFDIERNKTTMSERNHKKLNNKSRILHEDLESAIKKRLHETLTPP